MCRSVKPGSAIEGDVVGVGQSLDALNFALAGAREGFGPFLGVYLKAKGFDPAATGLMMSLAGLGGLVATAPIGALVDGVRSKRMLMVAAMAVIAIGALLIVAAHGVWLVGFAQVLIGIGDTSIAPLLVAITLGVVGPRLFADTIARNEAFNHAGNAANAALSAVLGHGWGLGYVAIAIVVMAVASSAAVASIHPAIAAARATFRL
jgi:predicted MFS family arabinose efflux permease